MMRALSAFVEIAVGMLYNAALSTLLASALAG